MGIEINKEHVGQSLGSEPKAAPTHDRSLRIPEWLNGEKFAELKKLLTAGKSLRSSSVELGLNSNSMAGLVHRHGGLAKFIELLGAPPIIRTTAKPPVEKKSAAPKQKMEVPLDPSVKSTWQSRAANEGEKTSENLLNLFPKTSEESASVKVLFDKICSLVTTAKGSVPGVSYSFCKQLKRIPGITPDLTNPDMENVMKLDFFSTYFHGNKNNQAPLYNTTLVGEILRDLAKGEGSQLKQAARESKTARLIITVPSKRFGTAAVFNASL